MNQTTITQVLESKLSAVADELGLRIAWDNIEFTPDDNIYLQSHVLPSMTVSNDLGGQMRIWRGVFQVDVCAPVASGKAGVIKVADNVVAAFPFNMELSSGVYINSVPSQYPALISGTTYKIPISMNYRVDDGL
ncbi:hypothetical protein SOASR030_02130 [Leminorella grimontii]|uniref:Phage protein n=1 Tax=Leminorella grimontii TaxID=82981 RepID=A0AAV5MW88_9GAMM|nr:phage tail terminator-like protein [Leminorella grimontii]GKX54101.1 hypothetical protein SOASR030_02130 [Leminorella grimontii]VFS60070.1 Uncharacterised protein [Leminorella grimontii]